MERIATYIKLRGPMVDWTVGWETLGNNVWRIKGITWIFGIHVECACDPNGVITWYVNGAPRLPNADWVDREWIVSTLEQVQSALVGQAVDG